MEYQYFEVCIDDGPNNIWMCIRGVREPSIQEVEQFIAADITPIGGHVLDMCPIDRKTAKSCYDFSYEERWPVFGL